MPKLHSKRKGANGERELAKKLQELGIQASRGQQFKGGEDSPDVETDLDRIHIECKRVEKLNIYNALNQAIRDAGKKIPVVCHRRNNKQWLLTVPLDQLPEFTEIISEYLNSDRASEASEGANGNELQPSLFNP